jgi:hypothetical protein
MAANYVLLEKVTVGAAGASSVTFNSIPQTGYTDLVIKVSARTNFASATWLLLAPNGLTTNLTTRRLEGYGASGTASGSTSTGFLSYLPGSNYTANTFAMMDIYIPNYTSANYKTVNVDGVSDNFTAAEWYLNYNSLLWSNTSAITSITLTPNGGSLVQYSTFYLYGVAAVGTTPVKAPFATGGDIIQTDGTYWYHAFTASGTFTPAKALSCDYLVVAGGGGGGGLIGGGGGAGGYLTSTGLSCAANTGLTVTIGGGGAGGNVANGTAGTNSVFSSITSTGGGYGGSYGTTGGAGGSGGGGGGRGPNAGGSASPAGQGFAGGTSASSYSGGAGGGGAGVVGANGTGANGTAGGNGLNTLSSWLSVTGTGVSGYIAGGGGGGMDVNNTGVGGAGGAGGGGSAPNTEGVGNPGTANTGGGGGGASYNGGTARIGGTGGSGIVIVRYLVA